MKIAVIGLGYVGLPLAVLFSQKYDVIGFDINKSKIEYYKSGKDVTKEVGNKLKKAKIEFTSDEERLKEADFIIIAVPTPVNENNEPDFEPLKSASQIVGKNLKNGTIIVYESTVYPGATEEICIPILEKYSKKICGQDFKVGYSPERINPGDKEHRVEEIMKIVSATDEVALREISKLYESVIKAGIYQAQSIKVAEAAKIIENIQRDINIAFMNEISMLFKKLDINTMEVLNAASTKWNFLKFTPGLVGGHCIGVDPYYLIAKAEKANIDLKLIKTAREVNEEMPKKIVDDIENRLKLLGIDNEKSKVAVLGITFKENVPDIRNSKAIEIIEMLQNKGINVIASDPVINSSRFNMKNINEIKDADIVVFAVAHEQFKELNILDVKKMLKSNRNTIYDLKNIFENEKLRTEGLLKISL